MAEQAATISAEKLCAITGLSDKRHRQIAKDGFFPPPIRGQYQLSPTLRGLFRYYRESYHSSSKSLSEDRQTKLRKEIELLDLKLREQQRKLVDVDDVDRVWQSVCIAVRQMVLASDVPHNVKEELCEQFRQITTSEYYRKALNTAGEAGAESD